MARQRIKHQRIIFNVNAPNETILMEVETDRLYKRLTGINAVSSGAPASKFSSLSMEVDSEEVFPKGFEVLRISFREQVPFGFDYHPLDLKAEGSKVKLEFMDFPPNPLPSPSPYPYTMVVTLRLENDPQAK